jgi:meso-butanediol dehydrogenase / (S,S)-butanediol dehydrogenase / diacetyl reductase
VTAGPGVEAGPGVVVASGADVVIASGAGVGRRYEGLVALVTGAASGLGRATALRLAAEGARVACLDIVPSGLTGLDGGAGAGTRDGGVGTGVSGDAGAGGADEAPGGSVASFVDIVADVRDEAAVRSAVAAAVEWGGRLDLVANVAGVGHTAHTTDVTLAEWERVLGVNLTGTFTVIREALPHLIAARGAIVNVASLAGVRGWRYSAAYSASKGGVVALTRALAVEYAAAGVRVSCVCPGSIDTPLRQALSPVDNADPALLAHGRALVDPPVSQPEEVAAAIAYLGSAEARFATGAVLRIDGAAGV